jgi:hypothetical protein
MIQVVPYNETVGTEEFKNFITMPFTLDMLYPIFNEKSNDKLFDGWNCENMIHWYKFTNENKDVLEFYPTYYRLINNKNKDITSYMLSIPQTINDFINDMYRFGVQLYWTNWIDLNFEPKEYLCVNKIKNYFIELLDKMGKSHELI